MLAAIADRFRLHGPADRATLGDRRLPSHRRAMQDIEPCRTATLGGRVYHGETCRAYHDRAHACKNRPCPQGQQDQAEPWLDDQQRRLLPAPRFLVPLTLPAALSALARRPQKTRYNLRFRSSAAALQALALAPRVIGGRIGMGGGLQTWTRERRDPPPVPSSVAGGGLSAEGTWLPARQDFLVHVKPLAVIFRAQCRAQLHKTDLFPRVDTAAWHKAWGVPCTPVGTGKDAFRYLAPDSFRVASSHNRILTLADAPGTFPYKDSATDQVRIGTVTAEECRRRFLQHGLPDRFSNVRDDGFLRPGTRHVLTRIRARLGASTVETNTIRNQHEGNDPTPPRAARRCPTCGRLLSLVETLSPKRRWPP